MENGLRIRAVLTRNELAFPAILFHVLVVVPRGTFASRRPGCSTWNILAHLTRYSLPVHRPGIPGEGQDALLTPRQWINVERRQTDPDPRLQMV